MKEVESTQSTASSTSGELSAAFSRGRSRPLLLRLPDGRWFDAGKRWSLPGYAAWGPSGWGGIEAALDCCRDFREALEAGEEERLWITCEQAGVYSGIAVEKIGKRVRAACWGIPEAWVFTALRSDNKLYFPHLWEEAMWISVTVAREYMGVVKDYVYRNMVKAGLIREEKRYFRGVLKGDLIPGYRNVGNSIWLPDVLKARGLIQLRKLFGKCYGYDQLEPLLELSSEATAVLKANRLFFHEEVYGGRRRRNQTSG